MSDPTDREFSLKGYLALLRLLRDAGYSPAFLHVFIPERGRLISRHDVDVSLVDALILAEVESEAAWISDYYVLLSSDLYNIASSRSRQLLRQIGNLGHAIGLHFDATVYGTPETLPREKLESSVAAEVAILQDIIGGPVRSLSFHRPVKHLQGFRGEVAGLPHSYEPRFFSDIAYVSDSRGGWHHGHPLDHPAVKKGLPLQLLTHPIWWTQKSASVVDRLERFVTERADHMRYELARNVTSYTKPAQISQGRQGKSL